MTDATRKLGFSVNITITKLRELGQLSSTMRGLATATGRVAAAMERLDNTKNVSMQKILGEVDKLDKRVTELTNRINTVPKSFAALSGGSSQKALNRIKVGFQDTGKVVKSVTREMQSNIDKQTAASAQAAVIETKSQLVASAAMKERVSKVNAAFNQLEKLYSKLSKAQSTLYHNEEAGVVSTQKQIGTVTKLKGKIDEIITSVNTYQLSIKQSDDATSKKSQNIQALYDRFKILKEGIEALRKSYIGLTSSAQANVNLNKVQEESIKRLQGLQKTLVTSQAQSQKQYNATLIEAIRLQGQLKQLQSGRSSVVAQRQQIASAKPVGASGAQAQATSLRAADDALKAYDEQIKRTNAVILQHNDVQNTSALVLKRISTLKKALAREEAASEAIKTHGINARTAAELAAAKMGVKASQDNLATTKNTLAQQTQLYKEASAALVQYNKLQRGIISSSQGVIKQQQKQTGLLSSLTKGFGNVIATQLKYFASTILIFGALTKLKSALTSIIDLNTRTARAFAVSRSSALLFQDRFVALGDAIENNATRTGISIDQVSESIFQFGSAGLTAEESMSALGSTMNLIQATGADVTTTTKTIAATFRLLKGTMDDTSSLTERFTKINDIVAATYRDNQVEINDFTQAMKFALPVANQMNLSLEETSGIVAFLHNNFIRGGEAGRALRVIFSRMSREMDQFSEAFGIAIDPNKPLDFLDAVKQVSVRLQEGALTAAQVGTVFERLGLRGSNAFLALIKDTAELERTISKLETTSAGAADAQAEIQRQSAGGQIKIFSQNMLQLGRVVLAPIAVILMAIVRGVNAFAKAIKDTPLSSFLKVIGYIVSVLGVVKVVTVAYALVVNVLGLSFVKTTLEISAAAFSLKLWIANLAIASKAVYKHIATLIRLNIALLGVKGSIIAAGKAMLVFLLNPYVLAAAAIAAAVYVIYELATANDRLIESNKKELDSLRLKLREYDNQTEALDKTIKKLEEIDKAHKDGRTTLEQTKNAIGNAVNTHGMLAASAATAAGEISVFVANAKEQVKVIQEVKDKLNEQRSEKFIESLEAYKTKLGEIGVRYQAVARQIQGGFEEKAIVSKRTGQVSFIRVELDEKSRKKLEKELKSISGEATTTTGAIAELANQSSDLALDNSGAIKTLFDMSRAMSATNEKAYAFGDTLEYLGRTARNLAGLPLQEKLDEVFRVLQGLGDLRLKLLFEFDFSIPKSTFDEAQDTIDEALRRIANVASLKEMEIQPEIFLSTSDMQLDVASAIESSEELAAVLSGALEDSLSDLDVKEFYQFDASGVAELFSVVSDQSKLMATGFEANSKEAERFVENQKLIKDYQAIIVNDLKTQIKDTKQLDVAIEGINSKFEDQVELQSLLVFAQQKYIAATTGIDLQAELHNQLLQETKSISLDTIANAEKAAKVAGDKLVIVQSNLATAEQLLQSEQLQNDNINQSSVALNAVSENLKVTVAHTKEEAESRLQVVQLLHQARLETVKSEDAYAKIATFGQDRVSQLRAELLNQQKLSGEEQKYLIALEKGGFIAKNSKLITADSLKLVAKVLKIRQQITDELFKQDLALLKSKTKLDSTLAGNSKIIQSKGKLLVIDAKLKKEVDKYNLVARKIKKGSDDLYKLGRVRITQLAKINSLLADRGKQVVEQLKIEREIKDVLLDQETVLYDLQSTIEETNKIKNQGLLNALEEQAVYNDIMKIQGQIDIIEKTRLLPNGERSVEQLIEIKGHQTDQAGIIGNSIVRQQQKLNKLLDQQRSLLKSENGLYDKQIDIISEVREELEEAFKPYLEADFDERGFSSIIASSRILGKNFLDIAAQSPEETIKQLMDGLRDGTIDAKNFNGEWAQLIANAGAAERTYRGLQEGLRSKEFTQDMEQFRAAMSATVPDTDAARAALDRLKDSYEVINPNGERNTKATQDNLQILLRLTDELGVAYSESSKDTKNTLESLKATLASILKDIKKYTVEIVQELNNVSFADKFFKQMQSLLAQLRSLDGAEITFNVEDLSSTLAKLGVTIPFGTAVGKQTGGLIGGTGSGDIVPAMLEPGEFVIPKKAVQERGSSFFEQFRGYKTGGIVQHLAGGGGVESTQYGDFVRDHVVAELGRLDAIGPTADISSVSTELLKENLKFVREQTAILQENLEETKNNKKVLIEVSSILDAIPILDRLKEEFKKRGQAISPEQEDSILSSNVEKTQVVIDRLNNELAKQGEKLNFDQEIALFSSSIGDVVPAVDSLNKRLAEQGESKLTFEQELALFSSSVKGAESAINELNRVLDQRQNDNIIVTVPGTGFAAGGPVPGVGSGDVVPAMLEPGEFVIPKRVVEKLGLNYFENLRGYKTGGLVQHLAGGGEAERRSFDFTSSELLLKLGDEKSLTKKIKGIDNAMNALNREIKTSNKGFVALTKTITKTFVPAIRDAVNQAANLMEELFAEKIPGFLGDFLNNFILTYAKVIQENDKAVKDITDRFLDQRADLVEQLKRNEISYFDYFNRLEDLEKDRNDSSVQASQDAEDARLDVVRNALSEMGKSLSEEIKSWIDGFDEFFGKTVDTFQNIGTKIAGFLEPVLGLIGGITEAIVGAIGASAGGGIGAAIGGILGNTLAPGLGAGVGVALGGAIGGVLSSVLTDTIPLVGDLAKAFEQVLSGATKGLLDIATQLIDLGLMTDDDFEAFVKSFETLPADIADVAKGIVERLPEVISVLNAKIPEIATALIGALTSVLPVLGSSVKSFVTTLMPTLLNGIKDVIKVVPDLIADLLDTIVKAMKNNFGDQFVDVMVSIADDLIVPISNTLAEVLPKIADILEEVIEKSGPKLIGAFSRVIVALTPVFVILARVMVDVFLKVITTPEVVAAFVKAFVDITKAVFFAMMEEFPAITAALLAFIYVGQSFNAIVIALSTIFIIILALPIIVWFAGLVAILLAVGAAVLFVGSILLAFGEGLHTGLVPVVNAAKIAMSLFATFITDTFNTAVNYAKIQMSLLATFFTDTFGPGIDVAITAISLFATFITDTFGPGIDILKGILQGIIDLIPDIDIPEVGNGEVAGGAGEAIGTFISDAILGTISALVPQHATGGVTAGGLAYLHSGEGILTPSGMSALSSMTNMPSAQAIDTLNNSNAYFGGASATQVPTQSVNNSSGDEVTEISIEFNGCTFSGEDIADQVEEEIANKFDTNDGVLVKKVKKNIRDNNKRPGVRGQ